MFTSLQALRGLAALGVVLFHLLPFEAKYLPGASIMPHGAAAGRAGVDLFFVLSGFLSIWTTRRLSPGPAAAAPFLARRLTRIYPAYWFYCLLLLAGGTAAGLSPDLSAAHIAAALLLVPSAGPPLLLVSWTLVFEVYFYLAYAVMLALGVPQERRGLWLLGWGAAVVLLRTVLHPARADVVADALLSPLVFEFLAGCAAALLCARPLAKRRAGLAGLAGLGLLVVCLLWCETLYAAPWLRVAGFGSAGALLLVGCVGYDALLRRQLPGWMVAIGDASYSLYLSHLFTLGIAGRVGQRVAASLPGLAATPALHAAMLGGSVLAALLVAWLSYRWIELPLQRLSRALTAPRLPVSVRP